MAELEAGTTIGAGRTRPLSPHLQVYKLTLSFLMSGFHLLHHALGGVRHLIWDTIHGFEPAERELLALATIVGSVSLTLVLWVVGYLVMGGPR